MTAQAPGRARRVLFRRRVPLRGLMVAWLIAGAVGISAHPANASDGSGSMVPPCSAQSLAPSPYSQSVLAYAPLGYWRLGTACATDSSGNGLNGSFSDGVATDPGAANATSFDGASGYVMLGAPAPRLPSRLSVEAWIKTTGNGNARQVIVSDRLHGYALYLDGGTGLPEFGIDDTTGTQWLTGGTASVSDGQWHYLVGTYDGYAVRLYVDGVPVSIRAAFAIDYLPTIAAIGRDGSNAADYFKGSISDVAIYGTQLAPTQVKRHYNKARQASRHWPSARARPSTDRATPPWSA